MHEGDVSILTLMILENKKNAEPSDWYICSHHHSGCIAIYDAGSHSFFEHLSHCEIPLYCSRCFDIVLFPLCTEFQYGPKN